MMTMEFPCYLPQHPGDPPPAQQLPPEAAVRTFPGLPFHAEGGPADAAARRLQVLYAARQRLTARSTAQRLTLGVPEAEDALLPAPDGDVPWAALQTELGYLMALGATKMAECYMYRRDQRPRDAHEAFVNDVRAYAPWAADLYALDALRDAVFAGLEDIRFLRAQLPLVRHSSVVAQQLLSRHLPPELQQRVASLGGGLRAMADAERVLQRRDARRPAPAPQARVDEGSAAPAAAPAARGDEDDDGSEDRPICLDDY